MSIWPNCKYHLPDKLHSNLKIWLSSPEPTWSKQIRSDMMQAAFLLWCLCFCFCTIWIWFSDLVILFSIYKLAYVCLCLCAFDWVSTDFYSNKLIYAPCKGPAYLCVSLSRKCWWKVQIALFVTNVYFGSFWAGLVKKPLLSDCAQQ